MYLIYLICKVSEFLVFKFNSVTTELLCAGDAIASKKDITINNMNFSLLRASQKKEYLEKLHVLFYLFGF